MSRTADLASFEEVEAATSRDGTPMYDSVREVPMKAPDMTSPRLVAANVDPYVAMITRSVTGVAGDKGANDDEASFVNVSFTWAYELTLD